LIFIFDRPLETFSQGQLKKVILDFQPTLLFIEHDKYFVDKVATSVVLMEKYDL